jgi:hypothetical protein
LCRSGRRAVPVSGRGSDELVTAEVVAQAKGRDMMIGRFVELLGITSEAGQAADD